jgi:hypothetical protein
MKRSFVPLFFTTFLLACLIGCGPGGPAVSHVTGKVTLDDAPLPDGQIIFRDPNGEIASAAGKVVDGAYEFDAVPGRKEVTITAYRDVPGKFDTSNPGEKVQVTEQYIPPQYNRESELTVTVGDSGESFDFDLVSS